MGNTKSLSGAILLAISASVFTSQSAIAQLYPITRSAYDIYLSYPDSAIHILTEALNISIGAKDNFNRSYCYLLLAKCYWVKANYRLSAEFGFRALAFFENPLYAKEHSKCLLLLGRTFIELGDLQQGDRFIQRAVDLGLRHGDIRIQAEAYRERSYFFLEVNQLDSAMHYSDLSLGIFESLGDSLEISVLNGRKSRIYFRENKFRESRYFAYQSMLIDSLVDNQRGLGISHYLVAKNELVFGDEKEAIAHLHTSLKINYKLGNIPSLIKAHELLAAVLLKTHRPEPAAIELQKAGKLKDELYDSRLSGQIQEMNAVHDLASKEAKIQWLEQENNIKQQQVKSQQLIITFAVMGILLLILFLIALARVRTIQNIANRNRAEHLRELDALKTRFFTNISHEFRTPITLILGPLKDLYDNASSGDQKSALGSIMRNGQRLHRLINQLLDLSKIEAGKMELHRTPVDVVEFAREISASYESFASTKGVQYSFSSALTGLHLNLDWEKIENVVHNLLSNAFKFTKAGDRVTMTLHKEQFHCIIEVSDTGIGISPEEVDKVFDRFYQVDSSHTAGSEGSGLGMALAKELVELHKGTISVKSVKGQGTTFTVSLPLDMHVESLQVVNVDYRKESRVLSDIVIPPPEPEQKTGLHKKTQEPVVLIIEDNADMRHYIHKLLSSQYNIFEAENGIAGMRMALETIPDLIISDVMMPEMDGCKLCRLIKNHELTSHIPVILLTAKADRESKLSGLETHAEDYLPKPFDADELRLIVRNRIEERKKMRASLLRNLMLKPAELPVTSLDEKFLTKVMAIIEKRMEDEHFSIDELSREAGFSNMHFYRKIKALSGQSPGELLRSIRLKRAADLLAKNSDHVTQIAYSVGFGSVSYFTKCFKEHYGVTPRQYAVPHRRAV